MSLADLADLADRERRLLDLLRQRQEEECAALLARARAEAGDLLRGAQRRARRQLREAVLRERGRVRAQTQALQAELDTARRQHQQRLGLAVLERAWTRLPALLQTRWAAADRRAAWLGAALNLARTRLPGPWTLRHPPDLDPAELDQALAASGASLAEAHHRLADPNLTAGLVIEAGGARLDASAAGLLADRANLEGRLLALLDLEETP